jgi:pyruvate dehydrogenase E2 component (dihydrolipoamide acetyltransferase)
LNSDVICEIETDKATVAYESAEEGYLAAIYVDAGAQDVPLGTLLAVMVDEEADIGKVSRTPPLAGGDTGAAPAAPAPAAATATSASASLGSLGFEAVELPMAALSPTMEQGTIASWEKAVGDFVEAGDVLAEVETDKATVAYESTEDGYLAAIIHAAGETVPVGDTVAIMVDEKEQVSEVMTFLAENPTFGAAAAAAAAIAVPAAAPTAASSSSSSSAASGVGGGGGGGDASLASPAAGFLLGFHSLGT